jgi:hypothetical protein
MNSSFDIDTLTFMKESVMDGIQERVEEIKIIEKELNDLNRSNDQEDIREMKTMKWKNMKCIHISKNLLDCIQTKLENPDADETQIFRYIVKLEELLV